MSSDTNEIKINALFDKLSKEAESSGYHINPDRTFTCELLQGLLTNENRYGYMACPCRLAYGKNEDDLDIICPCDYRDADLDEFGACYCALYVSGEIARGEKKESSIPDRRPVRGQRRKVSENPAPALTGKLEYPVWRCKVCGYLCAKENPPEVCPVCKAKKDRFERFL